MQKLDNLSVENMPKPAEFVDNEVYENVKKLVLVNAINTPITWMLIGIILIQNLVQIITACCVRKRKEKDRNINA